MAGEREHLKSKRNPEEDRDKPILYSKNWNDLISFRLIAPTKKPKYSVSVVIKHGLSSSVKKQHLSEVYILLACQYKDIWFPTHNNV